MFVPWLLVNARVNLKELAHKLLHSPSRRAAMQVKRPDPGVSRTYRKR
jgi:hypothetical protein